MGKKDILGAIGMIVGVIIVYMVFVWAFRALPNERNTLTNDEIIAETKKCEAAGMEGNQIISGLSLRVLAVICEPKENQ